MTSEPIEAISFNQLSRQYRLQQLQETPWDVLVIGGGITGAGVALEAVYRGLSVALLDQYDFASGTSSRSTKLAHGGFRYLAQNKFGLVREATTERNWLRDRGLPHLTRPTRFLYPILEKGKHGALELPKSWSYRTVRFGAFLYDLLGGFKSYRRGKGIKNVEKIQKLEPLLDSSRVKGAVLWYDSNIDDGRMVIETLKEAIWKGTALPINYVKVVGFLHDDNGQINGIKAIDRHDSRSKELMIHGKVVINATGIWTDELLNIEGKSGEKILRPTKGVHLVYHRKDIPLNDTFAMNSVDDNRFFFAIRRNEGVVVGTTDTDFSGDPTEIYCTPEDADYLRNTVKVLFPDAKIGDEYIQGTYAGLRPLVAETGKKESEISRQHTILQRPDGLYSLIGGKLTIFRKMAEDLFLKHIRKTHNIHNLPKFTTKKSVTKIVYQIALSPDVWQSLPEFKRSKLHPRILLHLYQQYGRGGISILQQIQQHPEFAERLLENPKYPVEVAPWIIGEVDYIVRHEAPLHLEDVLCRRMEISWSVRPEYQGLIAVKTAALMKQILKWTEKTTQQEIKHYLNIIKKNSFFFTGDIPIPQE